MSIISGILFLSKPLLIRNESHSKIYIKKKKKKERIIIKKKKQKGSIRTYLNRSEMSKVKHIDGLRHARDGSTNFPASLRVSNTWTYLTPVSIIGHAVPKPTRIVLQVIVKVVTVRERATGAFLSDGVSKNDEAYEGADDEEHDKEVEPHEEGVAIAGATKTSERDDHDGDADADEGPLEELETIGGVGTAAQPYAAADDGEGKEEGYEV